MVLVATDLESRNHVILHHRIIYILDCSYWGDILWIFGGSLISGLIIWRIYSRLGQGCTIVATVIVLYGVCTVIISISGAWVPFIPSAFAVVATGASIAARK